MYLFYLLKYNRRNVLRVGRVLFFYTTQSVKALSMFCEAIRMANQPISWKDFVLRSSCCWDILNLYAGATSVIMVWMIGTNVLRAWFALASRSALIWFARRWRLGTILWLTATLPVTCTQSSAFPVLEGKKMPSKVTLQNSLCDNHNGNGINRQLCVRLLNLEVMPVTRISNSAVLEETVRRKDNLIRTDESSVRVQGHLCCAFTLL